MSNDSTAPDDLTGLYPVNHIQAVFTTLGTLHGDLPEGNGLVVDVTRALRNPPDDPQVRDRMLRLTGLDAEVRDYVLATPGARQLIEDVIEQAWLLHTHFTNPRRKLLNIYVKCRGGLHRSVVVAEEAAAGLRARGVGVEVEHRDIGKGVVTK
ncbi:RapZ C-terminal domain-containing protein [Kitasatospora sp. HPMI-4]|uniref:RapZ C-terminal domain-containing protein n=1 Tax=Kitasatospora sp. HPMI-4 TaxID=3448443 RepID=UPI003F1A4D9A